MRRTLASLFVLFALTNIIGLSTIEARETWYIADDKSGLTMSTAADVEVAISRHDIGNMRLAISSAGWWGYAWLYTSDYFTGEPLTVGHEYPKGSHISHLNHAECWVGGIIGSDTLVSKIEGGCAELRTAMISGVAMEKIQEGRAFSRIGGEAVSEQDIIVRFTDTATYCPDAIDYLRGTGHIPLNIEVTQKTYAWSHDIADDFILFDVTIKNIGSKLIKELYFGVKSMPSVRVDLENEDDDESSSIKPSILGFIDEAPSNLGCGIVDTLNMMWGANVDGTPFDGAFVDEVFYDEEWEVWTKSATSVHGIFFLDYPDQGGSRPIRISYNWYGYGIPDYNNYIFIDFGPRHREGYRDFLTGGTGTPHGDANAYHVLSNGEIDYDVLRTLSIGISDSIWLPPPPDLALSASTVGMSWVQDVLSVGPFDVPPGASVKIAYAFACGEHFHTDPTNASNLPYAVDRFYDNLDFSHLLENASWARWTYDNPGYDTDGNGYAGEFVVCNGDTVYASGDGIPDWRCVVPPSSPRVRLEPTVNGIRVYFNGTRAETEKDVFSGVVDFEGYRIYCGLDERVSSLALVVSYDRNNFSKYVLKCDGADCTYRLFDIPFTLDSLRCLYGNGVDPCQDSVFDPLVYTSSSPYTHPDFADSIFYFRPVDYNAWTLGAPGHIAKVYPDEPEPSIYHPDSIPNEAYTSDGLLKYYEYEFEISNLLATVPYWISVTAFDFGNPEMNIKGLESSRTAWIKSAFPLSALSAATGDKARVYVYPNPYRGDAGYRERGFEGRIQDDRPDDRVRAINFANLPPKCKIYIYSLDGDLVRQLDHDMDPADPNHRHHVWNMITRNTQMVVTGLYYWVVEAEDGTTQIGKLVILF